MPSWQSRAVMTLLKASGRRRRLASAEAVHERVSRKPRPVRPPRGASSETYNGWQVHRLGATGPTVVYLHGGCYINEIVRPHWTFLRKLAKSAQCVVPIYPLAPHADAASVVAATADLLAAQPADTVLMGDSAGGGLALAATLRLRDQKRKLPARLVLISPWLDVTMNAPADIDDPMLAAPGLAEAGRLWAGDLDVRDPAVSPLYGSFNGLPPTTLLCGTRDLLITDSRTFVRAATEAGIRLDYREASGQPHCYPLMPTPEGRAAREIIKRAVSTL